MAASSVIPVLAYPDVPAASDWLCSAFGFRERVRIGEQRAELAYGTGSVILTQGDAAPGAVHVRVEDAAAHRDRALARGALITSEPSDFLYSERQYTAVDPAGHRWTFSEAIAGAGSVDRPSEDDGTDWISVFSAPDDPDVRLDR